MDQAILELIEKIASRLAPRFTFGHYDVDDIKQEIFLIALKGLPKHDASRGTLSTYLHRYCYSRLKNFKRDNFFRQEYDCVVCGCHDPYCDKCLKRQWKMEGKSGLLEPQDIHGIKHDPSMTIHHDYLDKMAVDELQEIINREIPVSMREDYLRIIEGLYVHKSKRAKIEELLKSIIEKWQNTKKDDADH